MLGARLSNEIQFQQDFVLIARHHLAQLAERARVMAASPMARSLMSADDS
jgi:hypothetical protein